MKKITKKIMLITPYYPPHMGGVQNYVFNIAKGLAKKTGWKIVVVTSNTESKALTCEEKAGIKVYRLPVLFTFSNTPIHPLWYFQIKKIIKTEKPDVINAHSPVVYIADVAALASGNIPFILTYHAGTMKKGKLLFDMIIILYERILLPSLFKKASKIICSSNFVKTTMVKEYNDKSITITPGVDIAVFKQNKKLDKNQNTVVFIGRHANMYRMKGLFYLLKAVSELPSVRLRVIGEKIQLKAKDVSFVGIKKGKNLVKEIQGATVVVLPSLAHMESFGMVLLEAMACKVPVIGTNIGGIPEVIINNQDGILVHAKESNALKKAIKKIVSNPELAKKMGENGYKKVKEEFTWEKKINHTSKVFSEFLTV